MDKGNKYLYTTEFKRDKVSQCNICKKVKALSWDHVPPKGGIILSSVEQETVFQRLTITSGKRKYKISQNGVKYRTICKECNEKVGSRYDPVLNDIADGVGKIVKSNLKLPSIIHYKTKPNLLIRAVLAHILAAKAHIDNVKMDQKIRNFIFNESSYLPEEINIFYWIHPYSNIVIVRDIAMLAVRGKFGGGVGIFNILKYFPIAYLITDLKEYEGLDELTSYRYCKLNDIVDIPLNLKNIKGPEWPEIVDNENMIFGGKSIQSSVYAIPKNR